MKKLSLKEHLQQIIFFLIVLVSFGIVVPVYNRVSCALRGSLEDYCALLAEKTGLELSYKSMSPSLLTGIRLNKVSVKDSFSKKEICTIGSAVIGYDIADLILGKSAAAVKDITIDGITVDFDETGNSLLVEKIKEFSQKPQQEEDQQKISVDMKQMARLLSMRLMVKNVIINYKNPHGMIRGVLEKIQLDFQPERDQVLVDCDGFCNYLSALDEKYVKCSFSASGNISQLGDGSSVILTVSDLENNSLSMSRLNMLLMYNEQTLSFQTIHNSYPLLLIGTLHTVTGDVHASLKTDNLRYGDIFHGKNKKTSEKADDFTVSIQADVDYGLNTKELSYSSFGNVYIPSSVIPEGVDFDYDFYGDLDKIEVSKLDLSGPNLNASAKVGIEFQTFKIQGDGILYNYTMENGGVISTEVYFDSLEKGFVCFAPQVMFDQQVLTAVQLEVVPTEESFDFSFEVSDYSHPDSSEPGKISVEGSYLKANRYVQANLSTHAVFLDSLAQKGLFFTESRNYGMSSLVKNFMMNAEVYFSSNIDTLSFNVPYIVVADTTEANKYLFLSLDGTNNSLNVSRFSYISGSSVTTLNAHVEKSPDSNDAFFSVDVNSVSIPYHFSGNLMENYVSVYGDYDFAFEMNFADGFNGYLSVVGFPLQKEQTIFGLSLDSEFRINNIQDFQIAIHKVEVEEVSDTLAIKPKLVASGSVSKYGAVFDNISYSDKISSMLGRSQLLWNINSNRFDSASFLFDIASENNRERLNICADVTNPMSQDISLDTIRSSLFISAQINSSNFNLSRLGGDRSLNNGLTGTISMSGTLEDPYVGLDIEKIEFMMVGKLIKASMNAYLEDKKIVVENAFVEYNKVSTKDISAIFDLQSWTGHAKGTVSTYVSNQSLIVPFTFDLFNSVASNDALVPKEFVAKVQLPDIHGSLIKNPMAFEMTVIKSDNRFSVFSSDELGLSGSVETSGNVDLHVRSTMSVQADISGSVSQSEVDLSVSNIQADFGKLFSNLDLDALSIYKGYARGAVKVRGILADPEFIGAMSVTNFDFSLPKLIPYHIVVGKTLLTIDNKEIIMPVTQGLVKGDHPIFAQMNIFFDRWDLDFVKGRVWTEQNSYCPADFDAGLAEFKGDANIDLDILFQDEYLDVTGTVNVRKTNACVKTSELAVIPSASEDDDGHKSSFVRCDLKITLGNNVNFTFDPLLRVVFVPNSVVSFRYDEAENSYSLDGLIKFKTGDVSYLNRNFYLKSGALRFNGSDSALNPLISVQAETRERDENGDNLLIVLSANNQYLSDFEPSISSIPAKSELEIRQILGQIVRADSDDMTSFLLATGDYALQSTFGRMIEGKLRDLLNFDILSIRTMILQNALKQSLSSEKDKNNLGIGNFLDNSTVYIGKYFGSSLYVDALLHWSYDENRVDDKTTTGGLVFKPELGIEIESPLANIRWNMAPDIDALMNNRIVSSTSVTLSWKFAF